MGLNVSSPLRKVSTSLALGGRPPGAAASRLQRTRPEACTTQTFSERRCGSPHIQALKGRTAVVLVDAGAPFAEALRCFGLVVHSCPLETLRMPQARDRINRLCRESSFVVYATFPLTQIDRVLAVRDTHGKPWPDTSSRTTGRCRTEDCIFCLGGNAVAVSQLAGECLKFLWPVPSLVFGPSTVFSAPLKAQRQLSHGMILVNTEPILRILLKWRVRIF